jgi:outer membrane protein insertion porin family
MALLIVCGWARADCAAQAGSVSDYLGRPVAEVRLQAEGVQLRDPALAGLVQTRVGAPLSMTGVRETIAHLSGLGRYQDIQVDASLRGDQVVLVYDLVLIRQIRQIVFRGTLGLAEGELRAAVVGQFGASPPAGRVADAGQTLQALYRDRGFLRAEVIPRTQVGRQPDSATLVFDIRSGVRTRVGTIEIQGAPPVPREQLLNRAGLRPGQPYDRPAIAARLSQYEEELRAHGYYEARINHTAELADDQQTANLVLIVEPGPHVTIVFEGDPLTQRERDDLVPVVREHSVDEDLLDDSRRRIENHLREAGYRDPHVEYRLTALDGELTVLFTIRRGPQYTLARLEIGGNASMSQEEIRSLIRLKPDQPFVESLLGADVARIGDLYRRRGYAAVKVSYGIDSVGAGQSGEAVTVRVVVAEGARTQIRSLAFEGNAAIGIEALRATMVSLPGQPFYEPQLAVDRDAVAAQYLNRGYENATVQIEPTFTSDRSAVDLRVVVLEGVQVLVDHVLIVGNVRTGSNIITREIQLKPGQPLSANDLAESQRRLAALGLFRGVRVGDVRLPNSDMRRDVLVTIEEAPATTIGYGGGLQGGRRLFTDATGLAVERFEVAPSGFVELVRRNLWGKNRSLNLFTRVSLRLRGDSVTGSAGQPTESGGYGFNEYRVFATYREPRVFGTAADALITSFVEQGVRSSFNFNRRGTRVDVVRRLTPAISVSGRYSVDRTRLFDEHFSASDAPLVDRLFPRVRLSAFSSSLVRDTRDDLVDPAAGRLIGLDGELAARAIGSEVGLFKTFLQGFAYRRLPGSRRVILAGGARLGLATGFPRGGVPQLDADGQPILGPGGQPLVVTVDDLPASERFFAGGDTTVRGFALDRLATPETVGVDGFPLGGNALLVFNGELRVPVWRDFGVVGFVDAGNVFRRVSDLDLHDIRGSVGVGLRYRSPVGPIRVDLGVKLDRRLLVTGERERATELHIGLGQAF